MNSISNQFSTTSKSNKEDFILGKKQVLLILLLIIILAGFLRLYKLDLVPPSLNWDEVAAAYNGYSIANFGIDEWGERFPLVFKSFLDDKHPVHIYTAALFIKIFGVSDFVARFPAALIGILSVLILFFLSQLIFKRTGVALFAAFLLAISPYNIHFSRGLWEVNFALLYFLLGATAFFLGIYRKSWLLLVSIVAFGLSTMAYHSSKIVVPPLVFLLIILYWKQLKASLTKRVLIAGIVVSGIFGVMFITNPALLGLARVQQTKFGQVNIEKTEAYKKTQNSTLGLLEIVGNQYLTHFSYAYLFEIGDQNPRNSVKTVGMFYKIELIFMIIGLVALLRLRSKITLFLLAWILVAPLPSALVNGAPNATRALFMMGSLHLLSGLGAYSLIGIIKNKKLQIGTAIVVVLILLGSLKTYWDNYINDYSHSDAIEWQYGMKQIVDYVNKHPEYTKVYMTDVRSQPYIFFLYYLKYSPVKLQETVVYNQSQSRSYNLISSFDRYQFGGWDEIDSRPEPGILYVVEPSKLDGLRYLTSLRINKRIAFPNGDPAFFIVSAK